MDTTGANATTGQNVFLTQDQLNQLLSLIGNNQRSTPVTLRPPPSGTKKASPWPEWDGTKELYDTYIMQLTNKIESDWDLLGGHKSVCMDMMSTLPKNLRSRVSCWASTGGPNADWNYEQFIVHFNDNFEDKTSSRVAGEKLSRMRQGQHQTFASYLTDFEYMLALAKGIHWEGRVKIKDLSLGLNDRLTDLL
ncbi:hypothetical protein K3495_g17101, partial [Podosphaera aphanis]